LKYKSWLFDQELFLTIMSWEDHQPRSAKSKIENCFEAVEKEKIGKIIVSVKSVD